SIHPFYDGNGRTRRIINILYLVLQGLLDIPVLYLSRYIIRNKMDYYKILQGVRTNDDWESMVLYLLKGVEVTSIQTIQLVSEIKELMQDNNHRIRKDLSKIYSQDLINNLFKNSYTKIDSLQNDLVVTRQTTSNYLDYIVNLGLLDKIKVGKSNYYINTNLIQVLANV